MRFVAVAQCDWLHLAFTRCQIQHTSLIDDVSKCFRTLSPCNSCRRFFIFPSLLLTYSFFYHCILSLFIIYIFIFYFLFSFFFLHFHMFISFFLFFLTSFLLSLSVPCFLVSRGSSNKVRINTAGPFQCNTLFIKQCSILIRLPTSRFPSDLQPDLPH
jgi:hypothetical protein